MGFLALAALGFGLAPVLFTMGAGVDWAFDICDWAIVGIFGLEYAVKLALAADRRAYVLNGWNILNLATIVGPLVSLLPQVSDTLRSSPALRLLRLARAVLFGARAGGAIAREAARQRAGAVEGPAQVWVFPEAGSPRPATWTEFLEWVAAPAGGWYHVSNLEPERFREAARAGGLPEASLAAGHARLEVSERASTLFLWVPAVSSEGALRVDRSGVLLATTDRSLLSLSQKRSDLHEEIVSVLPSLPAEAPLPTRLTYGFLRAVIDRNRRLAERLELEVRALELAPATHGAPDFFRQTFALEKELSASKADLWRLKGVLASLAEGRAKVHGSGPGDAGFLKGLRDEAEDLYETAGTLRENLVSVIDLHMNVASFEMNKVMRLLAVVSALGLIPAVVGGLFGMNVEGNPWPLTLSQVAFGVSMGMILCLYLFFIKGWLR
jgi:Mg2+ and Co2+ transporter CorA